MHTRTSLQTFTVISFFNATTYVSDFPNAPAFTWFSYMTPLISLYLQCHSDTPCRCGTLAALLRATTDLRLSSSLGGTTLWCLRTSTRARLTARNSMKITTTKYYFTISYFQFNVARSSVSHSFYLSYSIYSWNNMVLYLVLQEAWRSRSSVTSKSSCNLSSRCIPSSSRHVTNSSLATRSRLFFFSTLCMNCQRNYYQIIGDALTFHSYKL